MVASILSILYILSFVVAIIVQQAVADDEPLCDAFRITSPTIKNIHWTAGQCYQVSYDLPGAGSAENKKISVDLVNSETNQIVSTLVREEAFNATVGGTRLFNLDIGHDSASGVYYYLVTLMYDSNKKCESKRSIDFQVNLNPNSPPSQC